MVLGTYKSTPYYIYLLTTFSEVNRTRNAIRNLLIFLLEKVTSLMLDACQYKEFQNKRKKIQLLSNNLTI